jgi:Transposase DDE domain
MKHHLRTKEGREVYRKRGLAVEPVFGRLREPGFERLMVRRLESGSAVWFLMTTTHNFLKLA